METESLPMLSSGQPGGNDSGQLFKGLFKDLHRKSKVEKKSQLKVVQNEKTGRKNLVKR
jgi:hypothetical protein